MTASSHEVLEGIQRRRRTVVQGFLWTLFAVVALTIVINILLLGPTSLSIGALAPNLLFVAVIATALWLNRRYHLGVALGLIIVVVLAAASFSVLSVGPGESAISLLSFFVPVVLAGLLLDRRALYLTGSASILVVLLATYMEQAGLLLGGAPPATASWSLAIQFAVVFGIILFFLDRFGLSLQDALKSASEREVELKDAKLELQEMNATLERRVEERTSRLEDANRELEAFSYSVSHDLRAPLRAIHGFAQILEEDYAGELPADGLEYLTLIRDNARQMGQLIDDLLAFSRLSRQPLSMRRLDMNALVKQTLNELHDEMAGRDIQLELDDLPAADADPGLIKRLLVNLLDNALKFTRKREAARIEVGAYRQGDEHVFFVKDNGAGFDMRFVDKLFGVFQRLHSAAEFEGTGVGLALVQRIAARHGGRVWAEGDVEQGAAFYFTLQSSDAP